jgi:hypothetical protein
MKRITPLLLSLFMLASLEGTIIETLDTTNLLRCTFSSRHHNRIVVNGQPIVKVIFPEGAIAIRTEEESGQVFVSSVSLDAIPNTVSIITSSGFVQDIEISFKDIPCESLFLVFPSTEEDNQDDICNHDVPEVNQRKEILDSILSGKVLEGYYCEDGSQESYCIKPGVFMKEVTKLEGSREEIYIFDVINQARNCKNLVESDFTCLEGSWVYIDNSFLKSGERTFAIVSVRRP